MMMVIGKKKEGLGSTDTIEKGCLPLPDVVEVVIGGAPELEATCRTVDISQAEGGACRTPAKPEELEVLSAISTEGWLVGVGEPLVLKSCIVPPLTESVPVVSLAWKALDPVALLPPANMVSISLRYFQPKL